jgi:porin
MRSSRVGCTIALCLALTGIIADPTTSQAQSSSRATAADPWGSVPTDPNSEADNLATKAFDRVNVYGTAVLSFKIGGLPGQSWAEANWTNKPKIDLTSPFGALPPSGAPQAVGVLLGSPSAQALPINYKDKTWVTLGNFSQYLFVKDPPGAVADKLGSGQPLRGLGLFGRIGYAPEETNPITRHASVALLANGLADSRGNDRFGLGIYHNGISRPLTNDIARLTDATARLRNEQGLEVVCDVAITPAIRLIPKLSAHLEPDDRQGGNACTRRGCVSSSLQCDLVKPAT